MSMTIDCRYAYAHIRTYTEKHRHRDRNRKRWQTNLDKMFANVFSANQNILTDDLFETVSITILCDIVLIKMSFNYDEIFMCCTHKCVLFSVE